MAASRTRNFATVVYPDSAPENWLDVLKDMHIPAFVSPLHDKDFNADNRTEKKAHFHVQLIFDSVKTKDQVEAIVPVFGGVGVEMVQSLRGYARYLCHLDNPEKFQYNVNDVVSISGSDYFDVIELPTDRNRCIMEMKDFCRDNLVYAYCDLMDYAAACRNDWFRCLCSNGTYVMREYIKSLYWSEHSLDDLDHK